MRLWFNLAEQKDGVQEVETDVSEVLHHQVYDDGSSKHLWNVGQFPQRSILEDIHLERHGGFHDSGNVGNVVGCNTV
jgi:hypothetical protein